MQTVSNLNCVLLCGNHMCWLFFFRWVWFVYFPQMPHNPCKMCCLVSHHTFIIAYSELLQPNSMQFLLHTPYIEHNVQKKCTSCKEMISSDIHSGPTCRCWTCYEKFTCKKQKKNHHFFELSLSHSNENLKYNLLKSHA